MHNNSSQKNPAIATILVAAGRGSRMGGGMPKQYRKIDGKTVLETAIEKLTPYGRVIIVIHPDDSDLWTDIAKRLAGDINSVFGGDTRTQSVKNGLKALRSNPPDIVLIHDAARPFVSPAVIEDVIDKLDTFQAVAPALPIVDALKTKSGEGFDRDLLLRVQTPQGFQYAPIQAVYDQIGGADYPDDIAVAKHAGLSTGFSTGDERNIKLTYESDFMTSKQRYTRMGSGFDVHRICEGRSLHLGGVPIEAGFSLKGHSDADVALHAITDALLGAIAAGDIGDHFPPSDEKWRGASSDIFLSYAVELIRDRDARIDNIDLTIICERPKIKPHREAMRARIAQITGLDTRRISVKATTTEGLGYTGRGEGIAAQAVCSVSLSNE